MPTVPKDSPLAQALNPNLALMALADMHSRLPREAEPSMPQGPERPRLPAKQPRRTKLMK